jgi:hypothetical protein
MSALGKLFQSSELLVLAACCLTIRSEPAIRFEIDKLIFLLVGSMTTAPSRRWRRSVTGTLEYRYRGALRTRSRSRWSPSILFNCSDLMVIKVDAPNPRVFPFRTMGQ